MMRRRTLPYQAHHAVLDGEVLVSLQAGAYTRPLLSST